MPMNGCFDQRRIQEKGEGICIQKRLTNQLRNNEGGRNGFFNEVTKQVIAQSCPQGYYGPRLGLA
jgi:hypothetical protein